MPASSSSSTSENRFGWRLPGAFVCASSSTRTSAGRRARTASRSISSRRVPRYSTMRRGSTSKPSRRASVSRRPWASTTPTTTSTPSRRRSWAACSIAYVLPTPGAAPTKTFRRARVSLLARSRSASGEGRRASSRAVGIERQVQREDVDPRLAEDAELPALGVPCHERANRLLGHAACLGDARHLEVGAGGRDMRIESAAGRGDEVGGDRSTRMLLLETRGRLAHALEHALIGGPVVRPAGSGSIVPRAGGRGARVEIAPAGEGLSDERGAADGAVTDHQAAARLVREDLGDAGHGQGVYHPGGERQNERHDDGRSDLR